MSVQRTLDDVLADIESEASRFWDGSDVDWSVAEWIDMLRRVYSLTETWAALEWGEVPTTYPEDCDWAAKRNDALDALGFEFGHLMGEEESRVWEEMKAEKAVG